MPIPNSIGNAFRLLRTGFGETVTISGKSYPAVFGAPSVSDLPYLPDGGADASDSNAEIINCTPSDFPAPPAVGARVLRVVTGESYTVKAVRSDVISGVLVAYRLIVSKTPTDEATADVDPQALKYPAAPA